MFVVWDEDSYIPNIVIAPSVIPGTTTSTAVSHYGLLRATEEMLGLPLLGNAAPGHVAAHRVPHLTRLWVPKTYCHQAIFMNHASGAVAPPDAEVIQAGDAIWQRAERRGLVQGAVWPVRVAEVLVLAQDGHQGALVPDQGPV